MPTSDREDSKMLPFYLSALAAGIMALVLSMEGRNWWCKFGDARVYVNQAWNSSHTSQHLFDPYTFTHVLHGILFFWLAWLIFKDLTERWRFLIAIAAEAAWEVVENSNYIIQQYRENTASLDYFGDTIANSIGDLFACAFGFWIAAKVGWWRSLAVFVFVETALSIWIRDSLLLNVVMLLYPLESVRAWQMSL